MLHICAWAEHQIGSARCLCQTNDALSIRTEEDTVNMHTSHSYFDDIKDIANITNLILQIFFVRTEEDTVNMHTSHSYFADIKIIANITNEIFQILFPLGLRSTQSICTQVIYILQILKILQILQIEYCKYFFC